MLPAELSVWLIKLNPLKESDYEIRTSSPGDSDRNVSSPRRLGGPVREQPVKAPHQVSPRLEISKGGALDPPCTFPVRGEEGRHLGRRARAGSARPPAHTFQPVLRPREGTAGIPDEPRKLTGRDSSRGPCTLPFGVLAREIIQDHEQVFAKAQPALLEVLAIAASLQWIDRGQERVVRPEVLPVLPGAVLAQAQAPTGA